MSRASAAFLFPDGEIRYGLYNGTVDCMAKGLFENADAPWDEWEEYRNELISLSSLFRDPSPGDEVFPVIAYSDYGLGFWFHGTATKNCFLGPYDPMEAAEVFDGRPDWLKWKGKND